MDASFYAFAEPLQPAQIIARPNRFLFHLDRQGKSVEAHCPTTGRIGNLVLDGLPCLISHHPRPERRTQYTVEAIGLHPPQALPHWLGINQNAMNRYVEYFLKNQAFARMLPVTELRRETRRAGSRLDFCADGLLLEVKMPLQHLQMEIPPHIPQRSIQGLGLTSRLLQHLDVLGASGRRALMLLCFVYDAQRFQPRQEKNALVQQVKASVARNRRRGVEFWQANFELEPRGIRLRDYFPLEL